MNTIIADYDADLEPLLRKALRRVQVQMEDIRLEAERTKVPPVEMRDSLGDRVWAPLVIAEANVLYALVVLEKKHDDHQS